MPNQKPLPETVADLNKAYTPEEITWAQNCIDQQPLGVQAFLIETRRTTERLWAEQAVAAAFSDALDSVPLINAAIAESEHD